MTPRILPDYLSNELTDSAEPTPEWWASSKWPRLAVPGRHADHRNVDRDVLR
jgi:hypothetical protein